MSTMALKYELIASGYLREHTSNHIPSEIQQLITSFARPCIDSTILRDHETFDLIQLSIEHKATTDTHNEFELLFRASEHDFNAKQFHRFCDGKAPTITLIETQFGNVFGAFTKIAWTSNTKWERDDDAFLFLLRSGKRDEHGKQTIACPQVFKCVKPVSAIRHAQNKGPCFGDGCDVNIIDKCNKDCGVYDYGRVSCCYNSSSGNCFAFKGDILCGGNAASKDQKINNDKVNMLFFRVIDYEVFQIH